MVLVIVVVAVAIYVYRQMLVPSGVNRESDLVVAVPFAAAFIFLLMHLCIFEFRYSVLGNLRRTSPADDDPVVYSARFGGRVGPLPISAWLTSLELHEGGLEVSTGMLGSGYVLTHEIENVISGGMGAYIIEHHSNEVRSPIRTLDTELVRRINERIAQGDRSVKA